MNVKISIDAEYDTEEGFWFYEKQSLGLGDYFRDCVVKDIDSLATLGGIHEKAHGYFRLLVKRFPYVVLRRGREHRHRRCGARCAARSIVDETSVVVIGAARRT